MGKESLFIIKPDEESEKIAQVAVRVAVELGLTVDLLGKKTLEPEEIANLYKPFKNEPWFSELVAYMTSGEIFAYITSGENVLEKTLEVKRQIRELYGRDRRRNSIHSPKTEKDCLDNIGLLRRIFK